MYSININISIEKQKIKVYNVIYKFALIHKIVKA